MGFGKTKPPVGLLSYWVVFVTTLTLSTTARADWVSLLEPEMGISSPNVTLPMDSIVQEVDKDILKGGTFDAELNGTGYSIVPGIYGNAILFESNGTGHAVYSDAMFGSSFENMSTTTTARPLGFTVMLWFRKSVSCNGDAVFLKSGPLPPTEHGVFMEYDCHGYLYVYVFRGSGCTAGPVWFTVHDYQWHHVTVIHHKRTDDHSGTLSIYLDGNLLRDTTVWDLCSGSFESRPNVLGNDAVTSFNVFIDELNYWYEPLTSKQVADIYDLFLSRLGSDCATDADCPSINNMQCDEQKKHCVCYLGYKFSAGSRACVVEGLEGKVCTKDEDCQLYDQRIACGGTCACSTGYVYNGLSRLCVDYDECAANATCNATDASCVNTVGSYECICDVAGYSWNGTLQECEDINECTRGNGGCMYACENTVGSFHCSCADGFILSHDGATCLDYNECERGNGNCSQICVNSYGSRLCSCESGFRLDDDALTCDAVVSKMGESCLLTSDCLLFDENSLCSVASGRCECRDGFQYFEDVKSCVKDGTHGANCTEDRNCSGIPHLYCDESSGRCFCKDGYQYLAGTCLLVAVHGTECTSDADCRVHEQIMECDMFSNFCVCGGGYEYDKRYLACLDVDECTRANGGCEQKCANTLGSFECGCNSGYELEPNERNCTDVNECTRGIGGCMHACENTVGSFNCACADGFILSHDGATCLDVDECETNNGNCSHICIKSYGSRTCLCRNNFRLEEDGFTCSASTVDAGDCSQDNGGCQHKCLDDDGSFTCACHSGYVLNEDQRSCRDKDECADDNGGCEHWCVNFPGSRYCSCRPGYLLNADGASCYLVGGVGETSVKIRFSGTYLEWMFDFFHPKSRVLARAIEREIHPLIERKMKSDTTMVYRRFYVSGFENGSVVAGADLTFEDQLTGFQVSYISWLLNDLLDGVTVTTGDLTLTISGTDRVRAVRNQDTTVAVKNACSVVEYEDLCGEHGTCHGRDDDVPYCVCSEGFNGDACADAELGRDVTDSGPDTSDSTESGLDNADNTDGDGLSSDIVLMAVLLSIIPVLMLMAVACVIINRNRSRPSRIINSSSPYHGFNPSSQAQWQTPSRGQNAGPWRHLSSNRPF